MATLTERMFGLVNRLVNRTTKVKQITLTSAQILALNSTPITILEAPLSGYANIIRGVTAKLNYNSAAYATATAMQIFTQTAITPESLFSDGVVLLGTANCSKAMVSGASGTPPIVTTSLKVNADADPTDGNSTITLYIEYDTVIIS